MLSKPKSIAVFNPAPTIMRTGIWHDAPLRIRPVRRDGDAGNLRVRAEEPLVHPRFCRVLRTRRGLRFSPGRVAIRRARGGLVRRRHRQMVSARERKGLTQRTQRFCGGTRENIEGAQQNLCVHCETTAYSALSLGLST